MLARTLLQLSVAFTLSLPIAGCSMATDFGGLAGSGDDHTPTPVSGSDSSMPPSDSSSTGVPSKGTGASTGGGTGTASGGGASGGSAKCASTGPLSAAVAANATHSSGAWSGVGATLAPGAKFDADLFGEDTSNDLLLTTFHAAVPPGAKIVGIEVAMTKDADADSATDKVVSLSLMGAVTGASRAMAAAWPQNKPQPFAYGGASDTWSATLTGAQVDDPSFGLVFALRAGLATDAASIGAVTLTLTYCE